MKPPSNGISFCTSCAHFLEEIDTLVIERAEAQAKCTVLELTITRLESDLAATITRLTVTEDLLNASRKKKKSRKRQLVDKQ